MIEKIDKNPLHRALRIDKFTAAALEATLRIYLDGKTALGRIPVLKMISADQAELHALGQEIINEINDLSHDSLEITLEDTVSRVGGGALPLQDIPSVALVLSSPAMKANEIEAEFRNFEPPIIGRILDDRFLLDLRTIQTGDSLDIIRAVEHLRK
jgi:L-seryl-tRNA(Ser) seleniumtransferase